MTDDALAAFVAEALHPDEPPGLEEIADDADGDEGEEFEGMSAREAYDSLDDEDRAGILADPEMAEQWRQALRDGGDDLPDVSAADVPGTFAPSGPDVVALALANPATFDGDPEGWLAWASTADPVTWAAACAETGWPIESKPARNDLPVAMRWGDEMDRRRQLIESGDKRGYFGE
jgi:hypothetical protein